jgi:hypothetical protein
MKALVFGGTSGIGLACCWQLKKLGVSVVALSRDPSKATAEAAEAFTLTACNVLDREALAAVCAAEAPYDIPMEKVVKILWYCIRHDQYLDRFVGFFAGVRVASYDVLKEYFTQTLVKT